MLESPSHGAPIAASQAVFAGQSTIASVASTAGLGSSPRHQRPVNRSAATFSAWTWCILAATTMSSPTVAELPGSVAYDPIADFARTADGVDDRNATISSEIISYRNLVDGWDGAGSIAPSRVAINDALSFIDKIPFGAKTPEPMVSADGEVGFYWKSDNGYIDIGFKGNGTISYFAKATGEVAKGIAPYAADTRLPADLAKIIQQI